MDLKNQTDNDPQPPYLRELLKNPPKLFLGFHYEDLLAFIQMGTVMHYESGDVIIRESDYNTSAFLVAEGSVGIWKESVKLAELDQGSFLGETFLFSKQNRLADVVCETGVTVIQFGREDTLNYFRKRPNKLFNIFTKNIIEQQQAKIENMNVQMMRLKKKLMNGE